MEGGSISVTGDADMSLKAHSQNVCKISTELGKIMGLSEGQLNELRIAALLHDIGKIKIPNEVLNKKGHLTNEEMDIMKKHVIYGAEMVQNIGYDGYIINAVLSHHERPDGKGYPEGLCSEDIPLLSKIIAVADSYDAMTSRRIYRENVLSKEEALQELKDNSGKQFDPEVIRIFIENVI